MMRRIDLRGLGADASASVIPRADVDVAATVEVVRPICEAVRERGLEAVLEYAARFDGVELTDIAVPRHEIDRALAEVDPDIRTGLEESIRRLRATCAAELEHDTVTDVVPGGRVTQRIVPIRRVGLYVPGGVAPLVSSVIMNVVPAQAAGVPSLALASPPQKEFGGLPHPNVLAACALLGVDEVYAVGGAQAIAMFAYGAGACRPVELITGPGNIYTVSAKRLVKGSVAIDSEAGPTEIAILADDTAVPGLRRRRPDQPGRARPAGGLRAGHRLPGAGRARSRPSWRPRWPRPSTSSGSAPLWPGPQSASDPGRRPRPGRRGRRRLRGRAPGDPHAGRGADGRPRRATPARSSSAPTPRSPSVTTAPGPTTCFPPGERPTLLGAVRAVVLQGGARRGVRPGRAGRGRRHGGHPRRGRGPARARRRDPGPDRRATDDPSPARGAAGSRAVRRAAAGRARAPQRQREPLRPLRRGRGRHRRRGGRGWPGRSTATPTGSSPSCASGWPPISATGSRPTGCGPPTGPTR